MLFNVVKFCTFIILIVGANGYDKHGNRTPEGKSDLTDQHIIILYVVIGILTVLLTTNLLYTFRQKICNIYNRFTNAKLEAKTPDEKQKDRVIFMKYLKPGHNPLTLQVRDLENATEFWTKNLPVKIIALSDTRVFLEMERNKEILKLCKNPKAQEKEIFWPVNDAILKDLIELNRDYFDSSMKLHEIFTFGTEPTTVLQIKDQENNVIYLVTIEVYEILCNMGNEARTILQELDGKQFNESKCL
uniref:Uncharacterized protein n=1 Tax=Panagrolaimus sp. JU765 TaxID=591449 RepID=A0AC34PXE1_9BILA